MPRWKITVAALKQDAEILDDDLNFLRTNPKDADRVKNEIDPTLWMKIEKLLQDRVVPSEQN